MTRSEKMRMEENESNTNLKFIVTNARSIKPKIHSVIDYFDELDLSFAVITETWLKEGSDLTEMKDDLSSGHNIEMINRIRPLKTNGQIKIGGGVSILYNPDRIALKEMPMKVGKSEIVAAIGKALQCKQKIIIIGAYLPPKMKAQSSRAAMERVERAIMKIKTEFNNPIIIYAGDFNKHNYKMILENLKTSL